MKHHFRWIGWIGRWTALALGLSAWPLLADEVEEVENFALLDHTGVFHELHYYEKDPKTRAIMIFVQGNGCPLAQKRFVQLQELKEQYEPKGIRFWMLNSNWQDTREEVIEEAAQFEVKIPILLDSTQWVGRRLGLTRTAEALLIETDGWKIIYRGAIDDRLDYGTERQEVSKTYLVDAMEAFLKGEPLEVSRTKVLGCRISYPEEKEFTENPISYSKQVAPIIQNSCVQCHSNGGSAPFSFSSHRKVKGWDEMIQEVILTRRMPPWHADPAFGEFKHDLSLSVREQQILLYWLEQGARMEDGEEDPLLAEVPVPPEWPLGKPDYLIEIPRQAIPATGVLDYRYISMDMPFSTNVWVKGVEVAPDNLKGLHHVIVFVDRYNDQGKQVSRKLLAGYAPGAEDEFFPEGTGFLLTPEEKLVLELHYTTYGKEGKDESKIGIYLHQDPPHKSLHTGIFIDQRFKIPAEDRAFSWSNQRTLKNDILLYSMNPHMHVRGKSMRFEVTYPDGRNEVLLSVPNYDFNWQRSYIPPKPLRLPKGSKLSLHAVWDNSSLNPNNPDPKSEVGWGEQTFNEMFFGTYLFTVEDQHVAVVPDRID